MNIDFNNVQSWQDGIFMEMLQAKLYEIVSEKPFPWGHSSDVDDTAWEKVRLIMREFGNYTIQPLIVLKPGVDMRSTAEKEKSQ